jgi:hypothetical protein
VIEYQIEDADVFAKSDHYMVKILMNAEQWVDNKQYRKKKTSAKNKKKGLWRLSDATEEQWNNFESTIDATLLSMGDGDHLLENKWKTLKNVIINVGNQTLPKAKEPKNKVKSRNNEHKDFWLLTLFSRVHRIGKLIVYKQITTAAIKDKLKKTITQLNSKQKGIIPSFPENEVQSQMEWLDNIREMWVALKKVIKNDMASIRRETIKKYVERRQAFLETSPIQMISSALEREHRRIVLDRIVKTNDDNTIEIITAPDDIKNEVRSHLYKWTANPREDTIQISNQWARQYAPKQDIHQELNINVLVRSTNAVL